jgi:hypothetical protein
VHAFCCGGLQRCKRIGKSSIDACFNLSFNFVPIFYGRRSLTDVLLAILSGDAILISYG